MKLNNYVKVEHHCQFVHSKSRKFVPKIKIAKSTPVVGQYLDPLKILF